MQHPQARTCRRTTSRRSSRCWAPCWSTPTRSRRWRSCSRRTTSTATRTGSSIARVLTLFERGEEVDVITLSAQLEREGMLERAGGRDFVHTLAEFVPAAANAAHYAGIVREQSVLRSLIRVGNEIAELGYQHPGEPRDLLDRCEQKVFAIQQQRSVGEFEHIKEVLVRNFEHLATHRRQERRHRRRHRVRGHRQAHRRLPEGQPHRPRRAPRHRQDQPRAQHRAAHGHRGRQARTAASTRSPSSASR